MSLVQSLCTLVIMVDSHLIGYYINHSCCNWNLDLDECELESVKLFLRALNIHQDQCQLSTTGKIKGMWLGGSCRSAAVHLLVENLPQMLVFHNLTYLGLSYLDGENKDENYLQEFANHLSKHTKLLQQLEYLKLCYSILYDNALTPPCYMIVITSLSKLSSIRELHLDSIGISFEDCKALSELLTSSEHIEVLYIGRNQLSSDSVQCIVDGLSHNTSLEALHMSYSNFSSENVLHVASASA